MTRSLPFFIAITAILATACGAGVTSNNANSKSNATANSSSTASTPVATATPTTAPADDKAAQFDPAKSPTDAYKAAYHARERCDIPTLKKLFTKDVIDFMTDIGKADNKSLDDMIKDMCAQPQADTDESRNEKITGNKATIEYPKPSGGDWMTMDMVKEDGIWKLSLPGSPKKK